MDNLLFQWRGYLTALGRAPATITVRTSHIRRLLEHAGVPATAVTERHIISWFSAQSWGPAARASARASVRSFFSWCEHTGAIQSSPAKELPPIRVAPGVARPAADALILDALRVDDTRAALAVEIMATCGLRRCEVAGIRASDVVPVGQGWTLTVAGKGGRSRVVPCPPHLARRIASAGGYLFPGGDHGHISPGWLGKLMRRALPPGITPHMLRHRYGCVSYQHSRDIRAVQTLLGHSSPAITQIYAAASDESILAAARATWRVAA